jgi:hypothetical protein
LGHGLGSALKKHYKKSYKKRALSALFDLFKTDFERGFATQTLSQSQKSKALCSKAFDF